jgi:hypothetical protein
MNLKHDVPVYGDTTFRGKCPLEVAEQKTLVNKIRREYPDSWGKICTHIKNEGKKSVQQIRRDKAEGMVKGASDIVIGGFYCELKRKNHMLCKVSDEQLEYLTVINQLGYFGCIALGYEAAMEAFEEYINARPR